VVQWPVSKKCSPISNSRISFIGVKNHQRICQRSDDFGSFFTKCTPRRCRGKKAKKIMPPLYNPFEKFEVQKMVPYFSTKVSLCVVKWKKSPHVHICGTFFRILKYPAVIRLRLYLDCLKNLVSLHSRFFFVREKNIEKRSGLTIFYNFTPTSVEFQFKSRKEKKIKTALIQYKPICSFLAEIFFVGKRYPGFTYFFPKSTLTSVKILLEQKII
jgi:hypothetical protein